MATFVKGDVVVVPFPFSDLTRAKRRPALVVAELEGDDLILCQITGRQVKADIRTAKDRVNALNESRPISKERRSDIEECKAS